MARMALVDEQIRARKLFVDDGVTSPSEIAERVGVTRQTVSEWIKRGGWVSQRQEASISAPELSKKVTRILNRLVDEIDEKEKQGLPVDERLMKRVLMYSATARNLSNEYDERGVMIAFSKRLVQYLSNLPHERDLLKGLQRVMPGFFSYIEG